MNWIILILAGLSEVVGVNGIQKVSAGKKKSGFAFLIIGFAVSLTLLSIAMSTIPLGVAYAVWTGMGTVGSVVIGMIFYNDSADRKRIFFLSLIVVAVIGLRIVSN
ncbi:DMT family transporter [Oceanobacillus iheyensis]|uniref:Chaperonin n=1 Tax=Oceanobacillus iheyensis (strain DSM 14371 / CIP 107618 / JCM 11309 / KCTC 3954 / HTE831) TaxID=221109 RepID=Q8ELG4_OCEIH|nr:multidrug efflux SMR transporter [Oceanobacillus iheyensis]BAC15219.1 chaperonin [Oceanobacillus iheyensis HTE831]